jgi:hypothetical protein
MSLDLHLGTYNHQEGGTDRDDAGGMLLDRLDAQLDQLTPLDLDVLISTEANGWLDDKRPLELARSRLGLTPLGVRAPRHGCDIVIWIRAQRLHLLQTRHESGHPWWHAQARICVGLDGLHEPLWLFGAHFSPFVPGIRIDEAYATTDLADRLVAGGGDFNDDALHDPVPDRRAMSSARQLRHGTPGGQGAAGILAAAGFGDVATLANGGLDRREATAGFKDDAPLRCDRLYVGTRLHDTPLSFTTLPYQPELSDHRAIHGWLDLSAVR